MTTARNPNPIPVSRTAKNRPSALDWRDVTKAEREERNTTEIEIFGKADIFPRSVEFQVQRPLQQGKAEDQDDRPGADEHHHRKRAKQTEERVPPLARTLRRARAAQGVQE